MKVHNKNAKWGILAVVLLLALTGCDQATPTPDIRYYTPDCGAQELITAINAANGDGLPSEIQLPANCLITLTAADNTVSNWNNLVFKNGLPPITSEITIFGNNSTIDIAFNSDFGHFYLEPEAKLTLHDLTLSNGARPVGGAVVNNHGDFLAYHVNFLNNFAFPGSMDDAAKGGAIYTLDGHVRIFDGSVFEGNLAGETMPADPNLGGAIYSLNTALTINESFFNDNYAAGNGGAIYHERNAANQQAGLVIIQNTEFNSNQANQDGGALYLLNETEGVFIPLGTFTDNAADGLGGAIFSQDSDVIPDFANFTGNDAAQGGAVYTRRSAEGEISHYDSDHSTYSNNTATGNGGAIFSENSDLEMEDTQVTTNMAASCGGIQVGGTPDLDVPAGDLENAPQISSESDIDESIIAENLALSGFGGGVCQLMGELSIRDSAINNNQAATYGGGLISMDELDISGSTIRENEANRGGGLAVGFPTDDNNPLSPSYLDFYSTISGSWVVFNNAVDQGGGIWTHQGGFLSITKSTIGGNTAANEGGGVYQDEGGLAIENSTLADNTAWRGGGLYNKGDDSVLRLTHATVAYNSATDLGSDLRSKGGGLNINGVVYMYSSLIVLNTSNDCDLNQGLRGSYQPYDPSDTYHIKVYSTDSDDSCGFDTTESTPLVDSYNGSYVPILPGSPLIDPIHCDNISDDQLGVIRPQGANCEHGSIEYVATTPPPPPPAPSEPEETAEDNNCDPFAGLDIRVYTLSVDPETLVLPVYLRFQQEVPDMGEDEVSPYRGMLGSLESYLSNQQGFADRLYFMFRLQPGDVGRAADLAVFKEGCDDPVFEQPRLAIPEIQQGTGEEQSCRKDLGQQACEDAGGIWPDLDKPYCVCP